MGLQPVNTPRPETELQRGKYDDVVWSDRAACLGGDLDVFFPAGQGSQDELYAFRICDTCPVVDDCLVEALSVPASYDYGVWGMTSERQRTRIRRGTLTVEAARARNRAQVRVLKEVS